jgi:hypothetical protein
MILVDGVFNCKFPANYIGIFDGVWGRKGTALAHFGANQHARATCCNNWCY